MNKETRKRIQALPEAAPSSAVIAVWAGEKPELSTVLGWIIYEQYPRDNYRQPVLLPYQRGRANSEQTLRLWLLNNCIGVNYISPCVVRLSNGIDGEGVTPEAAFITAINKFAVSLRDECA